MKLLIAEDDVLFQKMLAQVLARDYEVILAHDGNQAWEVLQRPDAPRLAILDWVMPGLSGPEICRKVRVCPSLSSMYLIILTSKNNEADIVSGLRAGADDYITKPPLTAELRARVRVGERILLLQEAVEAQSALGNQPLRQDTLHHESVTESSVRRNLPRQAKGHGVVSYSIPSHEPSDYCPPSCAKAAVPMNGLLIHPLENLHSKR